MINSSITKGYKLCFRMSKDYFWFIKKKVSCLLTQKKLKKSMLKAIISSLNYLIKEDFTNIKNCRFFIKNQKCCSIIVATKLTNDKKERFLRKFIKRIQSKNFSRIKFEEKMHITFFNFLKFNFSLAIITSPVWHISLAAFPNLNGAISSTLNTKDVEEKLRHLWQ